MPKQGETSSKTSKEKVTPFGDHLAVICYKTTAQAAIRQISLLGNKFPCAHLETGTSWHSTTCSRNALPVGGHVRHILLLPTPYALCYVPSHTLLSRSINRPEPAQQLLNSVVAGVHVMITVCLTPRIFANIHSNCVLHCRCLQTYTRQTL